MLAEGAQPPDLHAADLPDDVVRTGHAALEVDLGDHTVVTSAGTMSFGTLVLAPGAAPLRPPIPGVDASNVLTLRDAVDAQRLRAHMTAGTHLLVIGAGLIGLEVAAVATELGLHVTVVDIAERPMARLLPPDVAAVLAAAHRAAGVALELGVRPVELSHEPSGPVLLLANGRRIAADVVLVATGIGPRTALAERAGLVVDDGILVDELLRTSHPDVLAAGDAVRVQRDDGAHGSRTEAWTPAVAMGQHVARTVLGEDSPFGEVPWAWSDQLGMQVQVTGDPLGGDRLVTRGDVDGPEGCVMVALRDGRIIGAAGISRGNGVGRVVRPVATLIGRGVPVAAAEVADPTVDLRALAQRSVE